MQFDPPGNISNYSWSATFVSWCVQQAGATINEFDFSPAHSVFVNTAIQNADNEQGVFRAYPVEDYAPQPGDIIHLNRGGKKFDFLYARKNRHYESHSAIMVEIVEEQRVRYAITIGGNEGGTVGRKKVRLDDDGYIVQRTVDPYISIIQTLKTGDAKSSRMVVGPAIMLPSSFRKHGTFIYEAEDTVSDYGSIDGTVEAMKRAGMTHAWVRIHGNSAYPAAAKRRIRDLIDGLQTGGIAVAGWGWCQGADPIREAALALRETVAYGLKDYVADIEEGVHDAHWTIREVETFCREIRTSLPGAFGVTSFALIDWHEPALMKAALPFVHFFNPQVYWFGFPNQQMVREFRRPDGTRYQAADPGEYMDLCVDRWTALMGNDPRPLVVTGQAYWSEGATQGESETRLETFLVKWSDYPRVAGINWWHFGGGRAMSHRMYEAIVAAKLAAKTYKEFTGARRSMRI